MHTSTPLPTPANPTPTSVPTPEITPVATPISITAPILVDTADEAEAYLDFDVLGPDYLPAGLELASIDVMPHPASGPYVVLRWRNAETGDGFFIEQQRGVDPPGGDPIAISGETGEVLLLPPDPNSGQLMILFWSLDGIGRSMVAFLSETFTESELIRIAESMR
jgi:hypothetical protein